MKDDKGELFKYLVIKLARNNKITVAECDDILNAGKEYANQEAEKAFNAGRTYYVDDEIREDARVIDGALDQKYMKFENYLNSRKDAY